MTFVRCIFRNSICVPQKEIQLYYNITFTPTDEDTYLKEKCLFKVLLIFLLKVATIRVERDLMNIFGNENTAQLCNHNS